MTNADVQTYFVRKAVKAKAQNPFSIEIPSLKAGVKIRIGFNITLIINYLIFFASTENYSNHYANRHQW